MRGEDLYDDAFPLLKERPGRGNRLLAVAREYGGRYRNAVGVEEPVDVERIKPGLAGGKRLGDDLARRFGVGRKLGGHTRRRPHQVAFRLDIAHEVHESPDRVGLAAVIGDRGGVEGLGRAAVVANPNRQHRLGRGAFRALLLHDANDRIGAVSRRGERDRHVHRQNGIVLRVVEKRLQRCRIAGRIRVLDNVDRVRFRPSGRKHGIKLRQRLRRQARERSA